MAHAPLAVFFSSFELHQQVPRVTTASIYGSVYLAIACHMGVRLVCQTDVYAFSFLRIVVQRTIHNRTDIDGLRLARAGHVNQHEVIAVAVIQGRLVLGNHRPPSAQMKFTNLLLHLLR